MTVTFSPASLYPVTAGSTQSIIRTRGAATSGFSGIGAATSSVAKAAGNQVGGTLQPLSTQIEALLVQLQVGSQVPNTAANTAGTKGDGGTTTTGITHHHRHGDWQGVPQGPEVAAAPAAGPGTAAL